MRSTGFRKRGTVAIKAKAIAGLAPSLAAALAPPVAVPAKGQLAPGSSGRHPRRLTRYTSPLNGPRLYHSAAEAARAVRLDELYRQGRIRLWLPQVPLFVGIDEAGKPVMYLADFLVVLDNGLVRLEDVKSRNGLSDTERSRAKRAAVRARYPHLELVLVTRPEGD
jgi:hypothetical protein